jgi:hypothetical protein
MEQNSEHLLKVFHFKGKTLLTKVIIFVLNLFFVEQKFLWFYILLCRPSEDSLQGSAIPDDSPSKDWQTTVALGRLLDLNPGLQYHNLVSLPMSHHCSHQ